MKHFLTLGMAAALIGGSAYANNPAVTEMKAAENVSITKGNVSMKGKLPVKRLSADVLKTRPNGEKQLVSPGYSAGRLQAAHRNGVVKSEAHDGYILYENFSGWDGEDWGWVPEGWTIGHYGDCSTNDSWLPQEPNPWLGITAVDGDYVFGILYSTDRQDEWFISPEVQLGDNMALSYWMNLDPVWFYSMENIDWDTYEYVGEKIIAYTLQIMIQEEGGEWNVLRDYAQEFIDYSFNELYEMANAPMSKQSVSLNDYSGKKVKVAFRYVGIDGNSLFIDAIGIGYPELDNVAYMNPLNTLYWGLSKNEKYQSLTSDYVLYPVYAPTTWTNVSGDAATYSWQYCDPETGDYVTSDNQDELTVTYVPDYRSEASMKNNFFCFFQNLE